MTITCTDNIPHHKFKDWKDILSSCGGILTRNMYYHHPLKKVEVEYIFNDSKKFNEFQILENRLLHLIIIEKRSDNFKNKIIRRLKLLFRWS